MAHWLMKTEPQDYSWERLLVDGETEWTGVRNHQAAGNMRAMRRGERAFFYRSQVEPAIVGVMEVSAEAYPEPEDGSGKFVRVRVKPVRAVKKEVSLKEIKGDGRFADFLLVRHSRLSVVPVSDEHWRSLCEMAGIQEGGREG
jgi:predicted RNA-binding protein with PUA-like domain